MELRKVYDELNMRIDHVEQIAYAGGNEALWNQIKTADPVIGDEVSISDAAPIYATNITAQIDPIQDLNGYDYPWVGGAGKNLAEVVITNITKDGVTYKANTDGTISVSGTALSYADLTVAVANVNSNMGNVTVSGISNVVNIMWDKVIVRDANNNILHSILENSSALSGSVDLSLYPAADNIAVNVKRKNTGEVCSGYLNIQLELGSTATSYEPYTNICPITGSSSEVLTINGDDITIALGRTVYGGTLDVTSGKLVVNKIYHKPSGVSSVATNDDIYYWTMGTLATSVNGYDNLISSHFASGAFALGNCYIAGNGASLIVVPTDQTLNTKELASAWVESNEPEFVYPLATPTTIQLAPKQIKLLQGLNNLSASTGPITIKYQPDNALGDILGQAQEFALNSVYIAPALDTGDKIADFAIGNTSGVLYETPTPEQTTRRTTKKSIKED